MTKQGLHPGTRAIQRAVSVLKAFTAMRPEWTLAQLSEHVGLHKTTVHRLLPALEGEGLVVRVSGRDAYRLGPELIALGARAMRTNDLRTVSRQEMQRLAERAEETVTLEVPVDGELVIVDEVKAPGLLGTHAEIGTRWPVHATSTGKALLAAMEVYDGGLAARGWHVPDTMPALTPRTITTRVELERELVRVRDQGYAVSYEELQLGFAAVGSVVRDHEGRPVAAISVGGATSRVTPNRIPEMGQLVRDVTDRISAALGAPAETAEGESAA
jgi:IclR family transcriptional regulator, acetate operon repressor